MQFHPMRAVTALLVTAVVVLAGSHRAMASDSELDDDAKAALALLYQDSPAAKALGDKAKGVLVFPNIVKAGFIFGAQGGDGVMLKHGNLVAYYNTAAVSYGLQAGVQTYGYALFFMSGEVLNNFENSDGWEVGIGPSIVVVDKGMGKDISNITAKADIYAFIFDQKGLMAGAGIKGSKITKLNH